MDVLTALWLLFVSAFVSATLLPGNSEAALLLFLYSFPDAGLRAIAFATAGNTLGGLTSYWIGRLLPRRQQEGRAMQLLQRYGTPALLLSWVPLVGDLLCVGAGWLRLDATRVTVFMAFGKCLRYAVLAAGWFAVT
jgi:membrane protein YqaA with SNARE-associated domain